MEPWLASVGDLRPAWRSDYSGDAELGILRHSGVLVAGEANSEERNVN